MEFTRLHLDKNACQFINKLMYFDVIYFIGTFEFIL